MKFKKFIYIIAIVFILISMSLTPIMSHAIDSINSIEGGKNIIKANNNKDNVVVAKAATITENTSKSPTNNVGNDTSSNDDSKTKKVAKPTKLSQAKIISASSYVNNYVNKNKKLPKYVKIEGYKFSIPEYMYLMSKTISLKNKKKNTSVVVKYNIKNPAYPNGNNIKGTFTKKQYAAYSKKILNFLTRYNAAPNYVNTKLGKMQYQTAVYGLNKALVSMKKSKNELPKDLKLNVPKTHKMNKVVPKYFNVDSRDNLSYDIITPPDCGEDFISSVAKSVYAPIDVKYNSQYLISTARCSCGKTGDYSYHSAAFINYCPYCKAHGTMAYYEDLRICPEGMWQCQKCDSDYCLVTGKEHIHHNPKYLKIANL